MNLEDILTKYDDTFAIQKFLYKNDTIAGIRKFKFKNAVANYIKPNTILEIGVRLGYSAAAFLTASPNASYLGIDIDKKWECGEPGYCEIAERMLKSHFQNAKIEIIIADSQSDESYKILENRKFDLVHIDGDHSFKGCLNDLSLVEKHSKYILVDDIKFIPEVKQSTDLFLKKTQHEFIYLNSLRGEYLIKCF